MSARGTEDGPPRLLVLGGHDPTGGAGVDADREAAEAHGVVACTVVTAWTDQDGLRVHEVRARPPAEWLREARAAAVPPPAAVKTGLLPSAESVETAADLLAELAARAGPRPWVVDPVLAASGGEPFLDERGAEALRERLLACADVVLTPNLLECARLAGVPEERLARDPGARVAAARSLLERGARAVVVKGGHGHEDPAVDLVLERGHEPRWLEHPRVAGASLHGSGCRFASALAAGLARGLDLPEAADRAGRYLARLLALAAAQRGGSERGPAAGAPGAAMDGRTEE